jgi:hypothetical protein
MKRLLPVAAVALLSLTFAGVASADARASRVDRRQARQHERIVHGIRSGTLTPREAQRLRRGQAHLRRMEARAKADGRITRAERRRMHWVQDRQSARIDWMKHNRRV